MIVKQRSKTRRHVSKPEPAGWAFRAKDAAQDAWLLGLNVISKAQDGAANLVETLSFSRSVSGVSGRVTESVGRLGETIESATGTVLGHAGVASRRDIELLSRRVSKLAREVEKLAAVRKEVARGNP